MGTLNLRSALSLRATREAKVCNLLPTRADEILSFFHRFFFQGDVRPARVTRNTDKRRIARRVCGTLNYT